MDFLLKNYEFNIKNFNKFKKNIYQKLIKNWNFYIYIIIN